MTSWVSELKELDKLYVSFKGHLPLIVKELEQLIKTDDPNVVMLYSRRCLEVIVTDLCETELNRPRKTEPLKGIIDKLNSEEKVPSHIIASMHSLNSMSTYGTHPKDFDPEQVKPVLNNLAIIIRWYLKYKDFHIITKTKTEGEKSESIVADYFSKKPNRLKKSSLFLRYGIAIGIILLFIIVFYFIRREKINFKSDDKNSQEAVPNYQMPSVETNTVTNVTSTTAYVGGILTSDGGTTVNERGVYWGTSQNPESTGAKLQIGSGIGAYMTKLVGLTPNTNYYIKAYAINIKGTAYGMQVVFTSTETQSLQGNKLIPNNEGSFIVDPRDNMKYKTVKIGTQTWMAENLKSIKFNDGSEIQNITGEYYWAGLTTPAYCWFNNNETAYKNAFGALYNWYTVYTDKICPIGWHVPTIDEWTTLAFVLGGESVAGSKLKEAGNTNWNTPNTGATNETGFSAIPGGSRTHGGVFIGFGETGYWWSSTGVGKSDAWFWCLEFDSNTLTKYSNKMKMGLSIRCIKN